jgi:hypothetical protein
VVGSRSVLPVPGAMLGRCLCPSELSCRGRMRIGHWGRAERVRSRCQDPSRCSRQGRYFLWQRGLGRGEPRHGRSVGDVSSELTGLRMPRAGYQLWVRKVGSRFSVGIYSEEKVNVTS